MSILSKKLKKITKSIKKTADNVVNKVAGGAENLLSAVGKGLNAATGITGQQEATYQQQLDAMEKQNEINKELWNMQNEYNTPASQLARMAEAGIDVNPIAYALGSGNLSNTAGSIGSASGFQGSGSPAGNPISLLMGVAQGIQGLKNAKADYNLKQVTRTHTALENDIMSHDLKYGQAHNLPVHSVPGMDATMASVVNKGIEEAKDLGGIFYNLWKKHRANYVKNNPDYNGW